MESINFDNWIKLPDHAAFGHSLYPPEPPYESIRDIRNQIKAAN